MFSSVNSYENRSTLNYKLSKRYLFRTVVRYGKKKHTITQPIRLQECLGFRQLTINKKRSAKRTFWYRLVLNWNLRYAIRTYRGLIDEEVRGGELLDEEVMLM